MASQRWRLEWEGLRGPARFTRDFARRDRPFLNPINGIAIAPVEDKQKAVLGSDSDCRNLCAPLNDIHQHGSRLQVVIPRVVMHSLEIPSECPCIGIKRNQRVAVQIFSLPVGAIKVKGGRAKGKKY